MKKLSIYMMALLSAVLMGCNEDFDPSVGPQSYLPESPVPADAVSVSTEAAPVNVRLESLIDEETDAEKPLMIGVAKVAEGVMPANTILKAKVEFSRNEDFSESVILDAMSMASTDTIYVSPKALQEAYYNEVTKNPGQTTLYVRTLLYTVTAGEAEAIVGTPGSNYFDVHQINFKPLDKLVIAPAYYIVGGPNDWAGSAANRTIKFQHSDQDVYVDPVFTVVFDAAAEGDTWFAIGDDEACDAVGNGDWSQLYGIVGGDNEAKEGKIERRSVLGADNSFKVPAGAKKIRVTLDMMEQTFKVEAVNIAEAYYLVGGNGEWGSGKSQKFSHSDADVFDDPIFTYVLTGGSDMWFAFGDAEALDAIDAGDWKQLFGTTGASEDLKGTFDRRYNLDGDHSFHVDGQAKFYRFTINALEMTYEITPLDFAEYFYEIGNESSWSASHALYGAAGDGKYQGYYYLDGEFKFKPNADNWDDDLEYVSGDATSGTLTAGGGPNCPNPGAGFYQIDLDAASLTYSLTKVNTISIIGTVNGNWDTDTDLAYNAETGAWEVTATLAAGAMKFRMNHDWAVSWGGANGDATAFDNLTQNNGKDLSVEAGTYHIQLFIAHEGNNKVVMTKQ